MEVTEQTVYEHIGRLYVANTALTRLNQQLMEALAAQGAAEKAKDHRTVPAPVDPSGTPSAIERITSPLDPGIETEAPVPQDVSGNVIEQDNEVG